MTFSASRVVAGWRSCCWYACLASKAVAQHSLFPGVLALEFSCFFRERGQVAQAKWQPAAAHCGYGNWKLARRVHSKAPRLVGQNKFGISNLQFCWFAVAATTTTTIAPIATATSKTMMKLMMTHALKSDIASGGPDKRVTILHCMQLQFAATSTERKISVMN